MFVFVLMSLVCMYVVDFSLVAGRKQFRSRAIAKAIDSTLISKARAAFPGMPAPAGFASNTAAAGSYTGYADLSQMAPHAAPGAMFYSTGSSAAPGAPAAAAQLQNARAAAMSRPQPGVRYLQPEAGGTGWH